MKPTTLLAPLGLLLLHTQTITATCFPYTHSRWGQVGRNSAIDFINFACTQPGGMFTGYYKPRQTKSMCPTDGEGKHLSFQVQNLNDHDGFDLKDEDCVTRLRNEILGCQEGGESSVSGWRFRAEPNGC
ncbi:uncharacterized protein LTR77_006103 [Saxophila tyrrhenica]|uniref:Secreted protein n=1 Tax=Saxophila tyrrhenica TaxID=1690608 RepID=A0AAV9P6W9_9PEZI|nr:hypothetical protein LTR77_006103 [Saxophila tyrrhenica]